MYKLSRTKSKKGFKSFISLLLVAAIVITGALAYLTATDSKTNTFTVGNVAIELTEPNWVDANGLNIVPGETIAKDPTIKNTGRNDAYVYAMITIPKADGVDVNENGTVTAQDDYQLFTYEVNEGWTLIDSKIDSGDANNYYLYAYNTALTSDQSTPAVFDEVTFGNITEGQIASDEDLNILVDAYAIQSDFYNNEATDAESAWALYTNQNGWKFPENPAVAAVPDGYSSLSFIDENGNVLHSELIEAGTPVDMYFDSSLAKDGYTFDWVNESTGDVAYSGMSAQEGEVKLVASYSETDSTYTVADNLAYEIYYDETNGLYAALIRDDTYSDSESGEYYVDYTSYNNQAISIPSTITVEVGVDGKTATAVSNTAFAKTNTLTEFEKAGYSAGETVIIPVKKISSLSLVSLNPSTLILPDSVIMYEGHLCSNGVSVSDGGTVADNLTSISLPYGVTEIPSFAFFGAPKLAEIDIPNSVKTIGEKAFYNCVALNNVDIPDSVTSIGENAFYGCTGMSTIELSSNLAEIGTLAFRGSGITSVTIPGTLQTFNANVFNSCKSLKTVVVEPGVTELPMNTFIHCSALETVTLPKSLSVIGNNVFMNTNALAIVNYEGSESDWSAVTINTNNATLDSATFVYNYVY